MRLSSVMSDFRQCPWDLGSAWQKGQDKGRWVGAPVGCRQPNDGHVWAWPWSEPGWPLLGLDGRWSAESRDY